MPTLPLPLAAELSAAIPTDGDVQLALLGMTLAVVTAVLALAAPTRPRSPWLVFLAVAALAFAGHEVIEIDRGDYLREQHQLVANEIRDLRARLEQVLYGDLHRLEALAAHIALEPDLSETRFDDVARQLLAGHPHLRNFAAAPGLVVRYVYPLGGNEGVRGFDYRAHPDQREAALRAVGASGPVIAGPVDLVQGGRGLIARLAVRLPDDSGAPAAGPVWGLVSTVIDIDAVYGIAGLDVHPNLHLALRGRDALGAEGEVFLGSADLFADDVEHADVILPVGTWELAARPREGWDRRAPATPVVVLTSTIMGLSILGLWLGRRRNLRERERNEAALRRARDEALSAARAKSRFLANMSHEIRTPMNGVLGAAQLLEGTALDVRQRELAEIIRDSARSLLTVLDDVLDLAKIEAGRFTVVEEVFDLQELLRDVGDLVRPAATAKGVAIETRWDESLPRWVRSDPVRIRQILVNLGSNAVKFTDDGTIRFSATRRDVPLGPGMRLTVADTGIGMSPEQLRRIFDPFVQADESTTRRYGGTGLGTTISRQLAELLSGELTAESRPGEGSAFHLDLPLAEAQAEAAAPAPPRERDVRGLVLLAEDNAVNARIATLLLERLGVAVEHAADGQAAVERAKVADLVLMDVHMPGMDGLEAARRLRSAGYARPIVALTADVMPEDRAACLAAGMNEVLGKPILLEELSRVLEAHLEAPP